MLCGILLIHQCIITQARIYVVQPDLVVLTSTPISLCRVNNNRVFDHKLTEKT